jgi:hypothetical protein
VREGAPAIDGIDGAGGSGADNALDGGPAMQEADAGTRVDTDGGGVAGAGAVVDAGVAGAPGAGGAGGAGSSGAAGEGAGTTGGGAGGGGGAAAGSTAGVGGSAGAAGASNGGDTVVVNLDPTALALFAPPIDSSRYAVAGYDAAAGVCVSIIWDYSNNGLPLERHCDDFDRYVSFPYVLVQAGPAAGCVALWGYAGLQPSAASGCIDPIEGLVDVRVEVEAAGVRYAIRAVNEPLLVGPRAR